MRRAAALASMLLTLVVASCGLPADDEPRLVASEDAPVDLAPSTVSPETTAAAGADRVEIFFIDTEADRLRRVTRSVAAVSPETAIGALLQGPMDGDPTGLTSNIPSGTQLISAERLEGNVLVLDLGPAGQEGIQGVQAEAQTRAFAQLVYTATALDGVARVRFRVEGVPIDARTDGPAKAEVNRDDYALLAPSSG